MSVNSSSAFSTIDFLLLHCSNFTVSTRMTLAVTAVRTIILLPLSTLVLYLGHQRWRQQRSFKTTSHSDFLTYHMAAMELIWVLVNLCYIYGLAANFREMTTVGIYASSFIFNGESFCHFLTCVERYLAVVHPITYLGLRNARGVRIRNISVGCVWLLSFGLLGVTALSTSGNPIILFFCLLAFYVIVISFCSLSVLCVLIRPGPGERGRDKFDQTKQRAFHTITAIMGVLCLWFVGFLVLVALNGSPLFSPSVDCMLVASAGWFNLPSSLVLPLLYLHRAGKLSCHCYQSKQRHDVNNIEVK